MPGARGSAVQSRPRPGPRERHPAARRGAPPMLILFFFYLGYMLLSNAFERKIDGSKSASVLAIIGLINLPIIKFSVDWWHTLHQPSSILRMDGPSIDKEMLLPLTLMMVGFSLFSIYLIITNVKTMLLEKKCEALILKLNLKEFS